MRAARLHTSSSRRPSISGAAGNLTGSTVPADWAEAGAAVARTAAIRTVDRPTITATVPPPCWRQHGSTGRGIRASRTEDARPVGREQGSKQPHGRADRTDGLADQHRKRSRAAQANGGNARDRPELRVAAMFRRAAAERRYAVQSGQSDGDQIDHGFGADRAA